LIGNKVIGKQEYNIRLLSGDDETDVQDLCVRCSDFFELSEGRPPEKDAGKNLLFDLPPGKTMKDKFVFGVYKKNVLIAIIDIVKDYKATGEWIIGLFMLGVLEDNHRGYQFWCKMGYIEVDCVKMTYGNKEHNVKVMNLFLK